MIQLLRRIGFPPFKRTRRVAGPYRIFRSHQVGHTERLEARVLLAADVLPGLQNTLDTTGTPSNAFAIFSALSRGGDELLAHAGVQTVDSKSATKSSTPANANQSLLDNHVVTTEDVQPKLNSLKATTAAAEAEPGDVEIQVGRDTFVIYNTNNGSVRVESESFVTSMEIVSRSGIFTRSPAANLGGTFDVDEDDKIFKLAPEGFTELTFGTVAEPGLTDEFVRSDLTINGSNAFPDPDNPDEFLTGGLSNKSAKLRLQVTSLSGSAIGSVNFGQEFLVRVLVEDKRPPGLFPEGNEGVFAAYMDITWDPALAEAVGPIDFSDTYGNVQSGTITPGLIDEIGAVATDTGGLNQDEIELARIRFRATGSGPLTFFVDASDISPQNDVLLFGETAAEEVGDLEFVNSQTVTLMDSPTAPDLVQFAKDLAASGAIFYGASWCPHCTDQKELFEDGQRFLPFVEVTNPDRTPNQIAIDNDITVFPTWVFADGSRLTGAQSLETLSSQANVPIPESNVPFLAPIEETTLLAGSPLHVPLDGYDPNGGRLIYTVTSDNPDLVAPTLLEDSRSMRINVEGFGDMVFQLFENRASRVTEQIAGLAESGFYDGVTLHRILNNFVIQGGDPRGDGSGGSDLPDFDDQYHVDLQHNQTGVLSMAKTSDDTNNSQFFITEGAQRHLDFNHSIFGQLVEGESNRQAISNTAVEPGGLPDIPVVMESVEVFQDLENSLVMLKANEGASGTANITVTVRDTQGHETQQTFTVNVQPDTQNGGPFLDDIPELTTEVDTPIEYQLTAQDVEGDALIFETRTTSNATAQVNADTGLLTITPDQGFLGTATVSVRVGARDGSDTGDQWDSQTIIVQVLPGEVAVDLLAASDTGVSDSDDITNATDLQFEVTGVSSGALVEIFADDAKIGEATASGSSVVITTANLAALGDGVYAITATQTVNGETSPPSSELIVELDQTAPTDFASTPPTEIMVGSTLEYDVDHLEEGDPAFRYSLNNAPTGVSIDPATGELTWTPTSSQAGSRSFEIVATDVAGNTASQTVDLDVIQNELMRYRLQTTDLNGNVLNAVAVGQEFVLQVFVEDLRDDAPTLGVFAAYLDVVYDDTLVQVNGDIQYGDSFGNVQFGDTSASGIIDEAGATAGTTALGAGQFLLFSVPMIAQSGGTANFTGDPTETSPLRDTLLHGLSEGLRTDQIVFEGTSLQVVNMTFANDDQFETLEESVDVRLRVLDNDIVVPQTRSVMVTDVSGSSNATISILDGQEIVYTPNSNFEGVDTFTYTITDEAGDQSTATVTVTVVGVNDPPTANDDVFTVAEDAVSQAIQVLNNDQTLPDLGEVLTITDVSTPTNGTATISGDGQTVLYTPNANFSGTDTFTYEISDGNGGSDSATVTVTVTEVNDAPVSPGLTRTMDEDTTLTLDIADVLANSTPGGGETGQTLTVTAVDNASAGSVSLSGNTITFTPPADFFGTATFTVTVTDDGLTNGVADPQSVDATVTVTVNGINDDPTASDDSAIAQAGGQVVIVDVLANDSSAPDGPETLTVVDVSSTSAGGTVTINAQNQIEYTPPASFSGNDTFTYTIDDGNGGRSSATVTVSVSNFVPGGVSGSVFFFSTNDRPNLGFSGVPVTLSGVDNAGNPVNQIVRTDASGNFAFSELVPGNYELRAEQPKFTVDGPDMMSGGSNSDANDVFFIELTAEGSDVQYNFTERSLDPRFSIWEALASSSKDGFYSAVHTDAGHEWTRVDSGWDNVEVIDIVFSENESLLTLTVREDGVQKSTTISRDDRSRVQIIGSDDDTRLVRIKGDRSNFDF